MWTKICSLLTSFINNISYFQLIDGEITNYQLNVVLDILILITIIAVGSFVSFMIFKISRRIDIVKILLQEKSHYLVTEQYRATTLLSQLVPPKIAKRMTTDVGKPEFFESVTVLYADICDIGAMQEDSSGDLITMVDDVYQVFEKKIERYNVSKLGCTGKFYIVICFFQ